MHSGNLYEATTSGTKGGTAPTHSTPGQIVSDGGVSWLFLATIGYTSFTSYMASLPNPMVANRVAIVWWNGAEVVGSDAGIIEATLDTFGHFLTLKVKTEDAWYSNSSWNGRYDPAAGLAIRCTGYGTPVYGQYGGLKLHGFQAKSEHWSRSAIYGGVHLERCIAEATSTDYSRGLTGMVQAVDRQ